MKKVLFLGDSHSAGYKRTRVPNGDWIDETWKENNYGEIYAELNNLSAVMYATPGTNMTRLIDNMKLCLDMNPEIEEVFVQSVHWNRHCMMNCEAMDYTNELPLDLFSMLAEKNDRHQRWGDLFKVNRNNNVLFLNKTEPKDYETVKDIFLGNDELPTLYDTNYITMKLWYEHMTPLQYNEYCRNIFIMDRLCVDYNCKLYIFRMIDDVHMPENIQRYGDLKNTTYVTTSVQKFFNYEDKNYYTDDQEHYNFEYHRMIAEKYIPWIKNENTFDR